MKIAIIGTGGVGGYFGALLAKDSLANETSNITFVARGEHYEALKNNGLQINTPEENFLVHPVSVVDSISKLENPEIVLLCTKTYHLEKAAKELAKVVTENTIIITLQNGLGNDTLVKKYCKVGTVYPGLVYLLASKTAPGTITLEKGSRLIFFGERADGPNQTKEPNNKLKDIERYFRKVGIKATASENIEKEIWLKYVWLTAFAGMTSLYRLPIGPIVSDKDSKEVFLKCLQESINVAESEGVEFSKEELKALKIRVDERKANGPDSKASMLVDIENKRQTEIESLSGTIVSLARKNKIETPCHDIIYSVVKTISSNY